MTYTVTRTDKLYLRRQFIYTRNLQRRNNPPSFELADRTLFRIIGYCEARLNRYRSLRHQQKFRIWQRINAIAMQFDLGLWLNSYRVGTYYNEKENTQ